MRLLPVLAMLACNPTDVVAIGDAPDVSDTGTTDTDDTTDTQDTEDSGTEPLPYPLTWVGTREIVFEGICEDTIYEEGEEVTKDSDYEDLLEACPTCNHIFEADTDPDSICDGQIGVSSTIYRGIIYLEEGVEVVLFSYDDGWEITVEAEGEIDGTTLTYTYQSDYGDYEYSAEGDIELQD
jgi:hypothetical protein